MGHDVDLVTRMLDVKDTGWVHNLFASVTALEWMRSGCKGCITSYTCNINTVPVS